MNNVGKLAEIDFAVSLVSMPGESECGDFYLIKETAKGAIIGVVDGLGHGVEAAEAAKVAVNTINEFAEDSIISIARKCHEKLKETRGVVLSLAALNSSDGTISWLGVGNVSGILIRANIETTPVYESIFLRPGVIGYRLPPLQASVVTISEGDLLILFTDGIKDGFIQKIIYDLNSEMEQKRKLNDNSAPDSQKAIDISPGELGYSVIQLKPSEPSLYRNGKIYLNPEELAEYICKNFRKESDDALIAVVKYNGVSG